MLTINLEWDADALAAPQSFRDGVQAAANILEAAIYDPITVNIEVGYGEYGLGTSQYTPLTSDYSLGGIESNIQVSYPVLRAALAANETSAADTEAVNSLPSTTTLNGQGTFYISSAEAKALGVIPATTAAVDGYTGFPTSFSGNVLIAAAIVEEVHALGMLNQGGILGLFSFTSPGVHFLSKGSSTTTPAYFSIDGGNTALAYYDVGFDETLFKNLPNDALSVPDTGVTTLSALDLEELSTVGFDTSSTPVIPTPNVTTITTTGITQAKLNVNNVTVAENTATSSASLLTSVLVPTGHAIAYYGFDNAGGGSGYFSLLGVAQADNQYIYVLDTELNTLQYIGGSATGKDTIFVSAYDETTSSFTSTATVTATTTLPSVVNSYTSLVNAYYNAVLRVAPSASALQTDVSGLNTGSLTSAALLAQLLTTAQSSSLPALLSYDFAYGVTPSSSGLTYLTNFATQIQAGNYTYIGGFQLGTTAGQYNLPQFSLQNTYVNLIATAAVNASAFNTSYSGLAATASTANRATFFNEVYTSIFGFAPSASTENLFVNAAAAANPAITTFQYYVNYAGSELGGYGAVAGVLLYTAEASTPQLGQLPAAAAAFLSQAATSSAAGADTAPYGSSLVSTSASSSAVAAVTQATVLAPASPSFVSTAADTASSGTGQDLVVVGAGDSTLFGTGSSDVFAFSEGVVSNATILGFNPGHDFIELTSGFTGIQAASVLSSAVATAGGSSLSLPDGSHVLLAAVAPSSLTTANIFAV